MFHKADIHSFAIISAIFVSVWGAVSARAATAEDVYLETCAVCHGAEGAGQTARGKKLKVKDLRSSEVQKLTDAQLTEIISKGKGKDMPPYETELGKDGVAAQVGHLRELAKKK
jgi:mono/diheme cytochrome c family protein